MVINATIIAITVLISTLFILLNQLQIIALSTVMLFVHFYYRLPKMIIMIFAVLMLSSLHKNTVIYEANKLFTQSLNNNKQAWNKSVSDHIITAEIITLVNSQSGLKFNAKVQNVNGEKPYFISPIIRLSWQEFSNEPQLGQVWRFKVRLREIDYLQHNLFFSYQNYLLSQKIRYSGTILQAEILSEKVSLRQSYFQLIKRLLPDDPSPLFAALSFGYRGEVTERQWLHYQQFGISHLIAISGLHVGLLFGFCIIAIHTLGFLCRKQVNLNTCLLISFMFAAFYVWLAGFSLPAMRALILLAISCCYKALRYKATLGQTCIYMLLITLIISPQSIYGISFILSFCAISSVFFLAWWFTSKKYYIENRFRHHLSLIVVAIKTQLLLFLLLLPVQVVLFSGFSWLSVIANLLLIPLFSLLILPVLLFAILVAPVIPDISKYIFQVLQWIFSYFDQTLLIIADNTKPWVDLSMFSHANLNASALVLAYIAIVLLLLLKPILNYLLVLVCLVSSTFLFILVF